MDNHSTVILRGRISNYRKTRSYGDFLVSDGLRQQAGVAAVASALVGSGGAVGLAGIAGTREQADRVEFTLDDQRISGWLMWSPFKEGDEVEVVAEKAHEGYQAFAVLRPPDHLIALYPHCSRGGTAHLIAAMRWWLVSSVSIISITYAAAFLIGRFISFNGWGSMLDVFLYAGVLGFAAFGLIAFSISRKFMPFVRMAEGIFSALGWKNVRSIDLPARTRKQRKPGDPPGLGTLYFRY